MLKKICLIIPLILLPLMGALRFMDGDEGFYAMAGRLAGEDLVVYRDFFYPQSPLFPYLLDLVMSFGADSWYSLRLFQSIVAVATIFVFYLHLKKNFSTSITSITVVLLSTSSFLLPWLVVVKTYSFTLFFITLSFYFFCNFPEKRKASFLGGLFLGLAVSIRIYVLVLLPAYLLWRYTLRGRAGRRGSLLWLIAGSLGGMLPIWIFWGLYPDHFLFNNFSYHFVRSFDELPAIMTIGIKAFSLFWVLGGSVFESQLEGLEFLLLVIFSYRLLRYRFRNKEPLSLSFLTGLSLILVSLIPTPIHPQYFCLGIPFLFMNFSEFLAVREQAAGGEVGKAGSICKFMVFSMIWVLLITSYTFYKFAWNGKDVPVIFSREEAFNWRISTIDKVTAAVNELNTDNKRVISWWSGYLVKSEALPVPGMENHFSMGEWTALSGEDLQRYHLIDPEGVESLVREGEYPVAVVGNWPPKAEQSYIVKMLLDSGYRKERQIGNTEIYVLN